MKPKAKKPKAKGQEAKGQEAKGQEAKKPKVKKPKAQEQTQSRKRRRVETFDEFCVKKFYSDEWPWNA